MINIIDTIKLPFRKDKELFSSLHKILGFYPHDIEIYKEALSHKSHAMHTSSGKRVDNERLEFLGDAIIEAVTSDIVYRHFEKKHEGFLTTTRSKLVQRDTLNKISNEIGIDKLVRASGRNSGHNSYIGGNAFEAVVGAIYLDRGYKYCMWFLKKRIIANLLNLDKLAKKEINFKSKLLEWSQHNRLKIEFLTDETSNSNKQDQMFHATVKIEGVECGKGTGYSKKESHQNAAKEALRNLNSSKRMMSEVLHSKEQRTAMEAELLSVPPVVGDDEPVTVPRRPRRRNSMPRRAEGDKTTINAKTVAQAAPATRKRSVRPKAKASTVSEPAESARPTNPAKENYDDRRSIENMRSHNARRDDIIAKAEEAAFNA